MRADKVQPVEPQVLDLIIDLVEHRERLVTRDELFERIWQGRIVSEATLSSRIKMARRALGDSGRAQALIRTIHGRGFRFVGVVTIEDDAAGAPERTSPSGNALAHAAPPSGAPAVRRHGTETERRQLTIVRCSLADAALALGAVDAEEVDEFLARARAILTATFETRGGHIAGIYPAGLLVYFGWPRALEDAASLAVQAALAVGPALAGLSGAGRPPAEARCGVATGTVVVGGGVAAEPRIAGGRAPMIAVRLMDLAGPGMIVVADSTRALLGGAFVLKEYASGRVAELGAGAHAWQVLGAADIATRFEAGLRARRAPLVGREEELALLRRRWQRAEAGDGQVIVVAGDAGIGKSRLLHDFTALLDQSDHWRVTCQCLPHHENSALHPVIREIERAARLERDDDDATRIDKIRRLLARAGQWSAEATDLIAELLLAGGHGAPAGVRSPQRRQELKLETLTGTIGGLARQRPMLFVLEDAHWIDPTTAELMHRIVDLAGTAPILVLITHRPDYSPPWAGRPHVSQLSLSRLTAADAALLARQVAGDATLSERVQAQIAARTDGVPLYVEELTGAILANRAAPSAGIPEEIPATLQDLLLSQLDRLGAAGEIAKIGAAIGRSFGRELLRQVAGQADDALDAALRRLGASGLVFATGASGGPRYAFKHALVQDAAYQGLTHRRRRLLHARIAAALEDGAADGRRTEPEILAQHYERAEQPERALACWRRAGEVAAGRYAHAEAVAHFRRALRLLAQAPEDDARLRVEAGLLRRLGPSMIASLGDGHDEVRATYLRLEQIGRSIDDERLRCDALFGLSQYAQVSDHIERSLAIADRYVAAAERVDDGRQLAIAHWIRAQDYWRAGRFADGVAEARRGRAAFDARQPTADLLEHPEVLNRTVEAYCACMLGQVETALHDLRAMAEAAREAANPLTPERTLTVLGVTHQLLRNVDETAVVVQQMTALSQTHRRPQQGDWLSLLRAWVLTAQGDSGAGLAQARSAMSGLEIKSRRPRRLSILAECFAAAGQIEAAQKLIARALTETEARGERFWEAELNRQQGELVLQAGGAPDQATAWFERALAVARAQEASLFELKAAISLGRVWSREGRHGAAATLVCPVLANFDDRLDFPDLRAARTLLDLAKSA